MSNPVPVATGTGPQAAAALLDGDWSAADFSGLPQTPATPTADTPPPVADPTANAAPATATPSPEAPNGDPATKAVETPAPVTTETKQEEKPAPLTRFAVYDPEGEVELPAGLNLEYKVDGKLIRNPVDKVVHLAQQSSFNARQATELRQRVETLGSESQVAKENLQKYESYVEKMLQDPDFYDKAAAEWRELQSPERRAQNAESELATLRGQYALNQELAEISRYTADEIMPVINSITEEFDAVTPEVLMGQLALVTPRFQVNGRVPIHRLPEIKAYVETTLREFAGNFHSQVYGHRNKVAADAEAARRADQAAAQAQKRLLVRNAIQPAPSNPAQAANGQQAVPDYKSARDILNDPFFGGGA